MKKDQKSPKAFRKEILQSAIASFKIEGIIISQSNANEALKKVELSLEKQNL